MLLTFKILSAFVALIHVAILGLEMFGWTTLGPKNFKGFTQEFFESTKTMAANQGLYNGFLALGLIWSLFVPDPNYALAIGGFFLGCVAVAGIYGAITVQPSIFYIQTVPATLGLVALTLVVLRVGA